MSSQPFLPTQIPGCILWFDPSDRTTVTTTGNQVEQIINKGTLNTVASNIRATGTIPNPPWTSWPPAGNTTIETNVFNTSALSTIRFTRTIGSGGEFGNGFNGSYLTINNVTTSSKARTLFAIIGFTSSGIDNFFRLLGTANVTNNGTNSNYTGFFDVGSPGFVRVPVSYSSEEFAIGNTAPFTAPLNTSGNPFVFGVRHTTLTASNYGSVNGINQSFYQNNALNNGYATGNDQMILGIGAGYTREFYLGELIYFDGAITDVQMRQMEGYLSWKWGNQGGLPANHPYKNAPPTGTAILNTTQLNLVNTFATPGTVTLPSTFSMPGRILTFKDATGSFSTNALTLRTNNTNQTFDSGLPSTIINTRLGWMSLIANTNNQWMTIGGTVLNTINTSTLNSFQISTQQISSGNALVSSLILRDQTVGSTNRLYTSSSLLYYNNGVTNVILAGTRQSFGGNFVAANTPFTPRQIAGLQLWLDAADQNTFRLSGSSVTRWTDKSSNATPLTVSTGNPQITSFNSLPSVFFNGSSRMEFLNYTRTSGASNINWFVVTNVQNTNLSYGLLIGTIYANNFFAQNSLFVDTNRSLLFYRIANGQPSFNSGSSITSAPMITSSSVNLTLGTYTVYLNGLGTTQTGGPTGTQDSTTVNLYLGNDNYPGEAFITGTISECLLYTSALTPQQRQAIEGYLAWKWNLVQNLPNDHFYKNFPPTSVILFNIPYFVSITGGASPTFVVDYNLASGATNTATDIFIYTVGQSLVANTTASILPSFTFTTDGTTNGTTGKLTANLTFNTNYIARVRINVSPSPGQIFSDYSSPSFLYGAGPTAAPTLGAYSGGATMSIAWTSPATTNAQPISGSNIYFATDAAGLTRVASNVNYTSGSPFTTAGNTNFTNGSLTFNTNYYALVQMSNAIGTTLAISASPALFGAASLAPTIGTLTGGETLSLTWTNNTSYARPTSFNQVYFYTNSIGTTLAATSSGFSIDTAFTTNGTSATGSLNTNLTFNTTYYARVASSNALNASWSNSSGVSGGVLYGAAPQIGTITSFTGGGTMNATLTSFPRNARPVSSSNVSFMVGLTVVATKTGYTGGSSYSTTGVAGDFTTGSLTFNTFYVMRLQLVNALGTTEEYSDADARFGDVPSAQASGLTYTADTYYGTTFSMSWTAPGSGTLGRPVTNVIVVYRDSGTLNQQIGTAYTLGNGDTSLVSVNTGVYGQSLNIGLVSQNALGQGSIVWGAAAITQYQFSMGAIYSRVGGANQTYLTTSRSSTRVQYSGSGITSGNGWYVNVQMVDGNTRTLTWQRTTSGLSSNTLSVNGTSVGNGTSGTVSVTNGAVVRFQWGGTSAHSYTITLTLS